MTAQLEEKDKSKSLWAFWFNNKSVEARNQLISFYSTWTNSQAKAVYFKYPTSSLELADYIHWATIGLIESINRFDPDKNQSFESFAVFRVRGEILTNLSKISDEAALASAKKRRIADRVANLLSDDKADSFDTVLDFLKSFTIGAILEEDIYRQEETGLEGSHSEDFLLNQHLTKLIERLTAKEQLVINYHYHSQLSFVEISEILGLSKGRVSQLHKEGLEKLSFLI